uniref:Uncharacterized protein n=1 Tax=Octopus bimaculoides TaxID=37653 RepID=A0A0L8H0U9_OCTBM
MHVYIYIYLKIVHVPNQKKSLFLSCMKKTQKVNWIWFLGVRQMPLCHLSRHKM